jgi:hypothetical protein
MDQAMVAAACRGEQHSGTSLERWLKVWLPTKLLSGSLVTN